MELLLLYIGICVGKVRPTEFGSYICYICKQAPEGIETKLPERSFEATAFGTRVAIVYTVIDS